MRGTPRSWVRSFVFTTVWDAAEGGNDVGSGSDTEVAKEDACVLGAVSLKRECSQFSVCFWNLQVGPDTPGSVHRRV